MKRKIYICTAIVVQCIIFAIVLPNDHGDSTATIPIPKEGVKDVVPTTSLQQLKSGLSVLRYDGDYGFQTFLDLGGATSDEEVASYIMEYVLDESLHLDFIKGLFGCSTIYTRNQVQDALFGRNFDWQNSEALILEANPEDGYASISTVNLDFIQTGTSLPLDQLPEDILAQVALYAPLDGMNEKGLVISVNMIEDADTIHQQGDAANLTTTTAIRLLLDKAANVEEAVALLEQYNLHSSMDMMIHFAIADAQGTRVVVEYMNNQMNVIKSDVVTNFYLSQGEKEGVGSAQSKVRYKILTDLIQEQETMEMNEVRDALDSVSKDNFNEFESTEWSIVYNLAQKEIHYYHREQYEQRYVFDLTKD